ncbi:trypsin-like peptidase [Streptomyces sp. PsTaAH-137]|nr:trypsin-like peptidase [Streptomyces sp. PsTaAH-137]
MPDHGIPDGSTGREEEAARAFAVFDASMLAACVRVHAVRTGYAETRHGPDAAGGEHDAYDTWGSGVFVAPGWVLTCAHVVVKGLRGTGEGGAVVGKEVGVTFTDSGGTEGVAVAVVDWAAPQEPPDDHGQVWPAPDMALLRLRDPVSHDCVWIGDRPRPGLRDVAYYGCTDEFGEREITGRLARLSGEAGNGAFVRLNRQDEVEPGMSGGPVLDLRTGAVVGLVKASRPGRPGGLTVAVTQLRHSPYYVQVVHAHDRWHLDRLRDGSGRVPAWAYLRRKCQVSDGIDPVHRTTLLGLLAEFAPPARADRVTELALDARGDPFESAFGPAALTWRDGLGLLYEPPERHATAAALHYVAAVAADGDVTLPPDVETELWRVVFDQATWHDARVHAQIRVRYDDLQLRRASRRGDPPVRRPAPGGGDPAVTVGPTALLELWRDAWEGTYSWRVGVLYARGRAEPTVSGTSDDEEQLERDVAGPLRAVFRSVDRGDDDPVRLEVATAPELFTLPVEEWSVDGDEPLGVQRPVVFRHQGVRPHGERGAARERDRWARLCAEPFVTERADCADGRPRTVDPAWLDALADHTVPVYCRATDTEPTLGALHAARRGGYPVALGRRPGPVGTDGACADFHRGMREGLGAVRVAQLPYELKRLRGEVFARDHDSFWALGLGLVLDDPAHPLPGDDEALYGEI